MALMAKDGGFSMIATVCSTWVFVNRATILGSTSTCFEWFATMFVSQSAMLGAGSKDNFPTAFSPSPNQGAEGNCGNRWVMSG